MTFDELRGADYKNPTVALFYGLNCAPCERLKPKLRVVCADMGVRLEEFNSNSEMAAVFELGIRSVPTVVLVHRGVTKLVFSGDLTNIEQRLRDAGAKASA